MEEKSETELFVDIGSEWMGLKMPLGKRGKSVI